ncbi:MAG: hypothetical protein ACR2IA_06880 [Pyrinomonadaceae bacterium]|jgi:hypothetical protein
MQELDEVWAGMLENALAKAESDGRRDVADYLTLKAMNDAIRQTSVQWLFGLLLEIAGNNSQLTIENENPHRFSYANASLVGSLLRVRHGVRCLTVEAGWTRTPNDGFMRGGALAAARITHFGMAKYNAELLLTQLNGAPVWFAAGKDGRRILFDSNHLRQHFQIFLGEI